MSQRGHAQVIGELNAVDEAQAQVAQGTRVSTAANTEHGKSVDAMTRLYREERKEHRMRKFFFREAAEVLGLVTLATMAYSGASEHSNETIKRMNRTLLEGFSAFMATDFSLKMLGGKLAQHAGAIGAVIGVGVGLLSWIRETDEAAKKAAEEGLKSFEDRLRSLARVNMVKDIQAIEAAIRKTDKAIKEIQEDRRNWSDQEIAKEPKFSLGGKEEPVLKAGAQARVAALQEANKENKLALESAKGIAEEQENQNRQLTGIVEIQKDRISQLDKQIAQESNINKLMGLQKKHMQEQAELALLTNKRVYDPQRLKTAADLAQEQLGFNRSMSYDEILKKVEAGESFGLRNKAPLMNVKNLQVEAGITIDLYRELMHVVRESDRAEEEFLSNLHQSLGMLGTGLDAVGINADSLVAKLVRAGELVLQAGKSLQLLNSGNTLSGGLGIIGTLLSFGGLFHNGGIIRAHGGLQLGSYGGRREVPVLALEGEEVLAPNDPRHRKNLRGQSVAVHVTMNVNAIDSRSFGQTIRQASFRDEIANMLEDALGKGKI